MILSRSRDGKGTLKCNLVIGGYLGAWIMDPSGKAEKGNLCPEKLF